MNIVTHTSWSSSDFCLNATSLPLSEVGGTAYDRVCRSDFSVPGFCLVDLGSAATSASLRRTMISLKNEMQRIHQSRLGRDLVFLSAGRFDQQTTTKLHRDGGPDESFLMLGYEPSQIPAQVAMSDYSKCAFDIGLTPGQFLEKHNPMFIGGEQLLQPYTTRVTCFSNRNSQILLINDFGPIARCQVTAMVGLLGGLIAVWVYGRSKREPLKSDQETNGE